MKPLPLWKRVFVYGLVYGVLPIDFLVGFCKGVSRAWFNSGIISDTMSHVRECNRSRDSAIRYANGESYEEQHAKEMERIYGFKARTGKRIEH
jgi:hypothetical protein